ncbi:hypothetical protein NA57DRAFT_72223 [Rhizodiscina lignyota]|uniref:FAD-binding FR-type domain-containing protein n=1 Tax=Rhizodiscina lignyota TaxID=1504668 RepID=A0A9P4IRM7_9PEZI|nr:hypothetical protein NA57DRAFT_72223 [Rhizodiscina lignyota]
MANQLAIMIYIWCLSGTFASFIVWRIWLLFSDQARNWVLAAVRKRLVYSLVARRLKGSSSLSYAHLTFLLLYVAANLIALLIGLPSRKELSQRSASLFVINSIPLYLGGRTSIFVDRVLQIPLNTYYLAHRWLGRICASLAAIHVAVSLFRTNGKLDGIDSALISVLGSLALLSLLPVRRRLYEVFRVSHSWLAIALIGLIWVHIGIRQRLPAICLGIASGIWIFQQLFRIFSIAKRNRGLRAKNTTDVQYIEESSGLAQTMRLKINLRRPWKIQPGQYVYLTIPAVGRLGAGYLQAHPYFVAWATEGATNSITLLIESRRGFSRDLLLSRQTALSALIEGPYGTGLQLDEYDTVLLMANGIGICPLLLAAKCLVEAHLNKTARVRRLTLVWLLDSPGQEALAIDFLHQLLEQDAVRRILTVHLYVDNPAQGRPVAKGPIRLFRVNQTLDMSWMIETEWRAEAGNMAIAACGPPDFEYAIRQALRRTASDIRLVNLGFEPDAHRASAKLAERFVVRAAGAQPGRKSEKETEAVGRRNGEIEIIERRNERELVITNV